MQKGQAAGCLHCHVAPLHTVKVALPRSTPRAEQVAQVAGLAELQRKHDRLVPVLDAQQLHEVLVPE